MGRSAWVGRSVGSRGLYVLPRHSLAADWCSAADQVARIRLPGTPIRPARRAYAAPVTASAAAAPVTPHSAGRPQVRICRRAPPNVPQISPRRITAKLCIVPLPTTTTVVCDEAIVTSATDGRNCCCCCYCRCFQSNDSRKQVDGLIRLVKL